MTYSPSHSLCLAIFTLLATGVAGSVAPAASTSIRLENNHVLLEIDPAFGTICRILDKSSGIALAPTPVLAENFRLVVLLPNQSAAMIMGQDQKLSIVSRASDGLALRWNGPLKDTAGAEHKIAVRMDVKAVGNELQFGLHLDNSTNYKVKEAWYPMIGGLTKFGPLGKPADGVLWGPSSPPKKIDSSFGSETFGYPGQASMSFSCVQSAAAQKSLYFASHDQIARYKIFHFEKHVKDSAADVFTCIQHLPFTPPGKTFDGSTVVLRVVDGDWHAAAHVYRAWFEQTFGVCKPSECWIRRQSFVVDTMFELPEGTINLRFQDIPPWAKDAKDHGIGAVQISGWHHGGHDNGYPDYTPDPRLGTWKELEDSIKACHEMGLKVYFFVNYQPVMIESQWYKNELHKYHEWGDPSGNPTWNTGWAMGTVWGRMGHPKRMVWADPAFPEYRKIIVNQFAKLAEIGADGVHVDKMFPSAINYNPNLPLGPDTATWEGAITLTKEVFTACRKHNPDWAMSFESNWDRMMQFTCSTWWGGGFNRDVFPDSVGTMSITSPYDYLGVNNLVCGRCTVLVGPMNYCRSVGWKPWEGLANYLKEVKRIQDRLADTVWLGEELGGGVFRNRNTGKHLCILSNSAMQPRKQAIATFEANRTGKARIHIPFQPAKVVKLPAEIEIPGERLAFVEEL